MPLSPARQRLATACSAANSLPNYLAQISGQGPNSQTQGDCQVYADFAATGTVAPQQAVGIGCVYPSAVRMALTSSKPRD